MNAAGFAGGELVVWDKRSLKMIDKEVGSFSISCRFKNVDNNFIWAFTGVMVLSLGRIDLHCGKN